MRIVAVGDARSPRNVSRLQQRGSKENRFRKKFVIARDHPITSCVKTPPAAML
jgi:hypothetical protein